MLFPFTRWPDNEHQLKGQHPAQNDDCIQMSAVFEWNHVARPSWFTKQLIVGGLFWQNEDPNADKGHRWEGKKNPDRTKENQNMKNPQKVAKKQTPTTEPTTDLAEKTWSWQQTD